MGIHIYCKTSVFKTDFSSSYTYWNNLRLSVMNSFITFLIDWLNKTNYTEDDGFELYFHKNLFKLVSEINNINEPDVDKFFVIIPKYEAELNCFGFSGIIYFICKKDCESYWSPGNAYDIDCLFELINNFIEEQYKESISTVKKVFDYSIYNNEPICIA
jgi:hypothetical protein